MLVPREDEVVCPWSIFVFGTGDGSGTASPAFLRFALVSLFIATYTQISL